VAKLRVRCTTRTTRSLWRSSGCVAPATSSYIRHEKEAAKVVSTASFWDCCPIVDCVERNSSRPHPVAQEPVLAVYRVSGETALGSLVASYLLYRLGPRGWAVLTAAGISRRLGVGRVGVEAALRKMVRRREILIRGPLIMARGLWTRPGRGYRVDIPWADIGHGTPGELLFLGKLVADQKHSRKRPWRRRVLSGWRHFAADLSYSLRQTARVFHNLHHRGWIVAKEVISYAHGNRYRNYAYAYVGASDRRNNCRVMVERVANQLKLSPRYRAAGGNDRSRRIVSPLPVREDQTQINRRARPRSRTFERGISSETAHNRGPPDGGSRHHGVRSRWSLGELLRMVGWPASP
jgi:hypothetical protein